MDLPRPDNQAKMVFAWIVRLNAPACRLMRNYTASATLRFCGAPPIRKNWLPGQKPWATAPSPSPTNAACPESSAPMSRPGKKVSTCLLAASSDYGKGGAFCCWPPTGAATANSPTSSPWLAGRQKKGSILSTGTWFRTTVPPVAWPSGCLALTGGRPKQTACAGWPVFSPGHCG